MRGDAQVRWWLLLGLLGGVGAFPQIAGAGTWAGPDDRALRSDLELLAAKGFIPNLLSTWPLPDGAISALQGLAMDQQPADVQAAVKHVIAARLSGQPRGFTPSGAIYSTNEPSLIRDFGDHARQPLDASARFDWTTKNFNLTVQAGGQTHYNGDEGHFALDGTRAVALVGNAQIYAGWVDQWYGPGWVSALTLSNNARPFPKIGLMRNNPHAFESKWLSWIGPWQINTFAGLLDGPRVDTDTVSFGLRLSFNPIQPLEIGLTRVTELCGANHPCKPFTALVDFNNDPANTNKVNEQANIDARYTWVVHKTIITPYFQIMNEDTGPFTHGYTSHQYGSSFSGPLGAAGARWRMVLEYTDSVPTLNIFSYGKYAYGTSYNNSGYTDGFRYRDQSMGFSLDSDSRLASVVWLITDAQGWSWHAAAHFASISDIPIAGQTQETGAYNVLTTQPQRVTLGEVGVAIPVHGLTVDLSARAQNRVLEPIQSERYAAELGLIYRY